MIRLTILTGVSLSIFLTVQAIAAEIHQENDDERRTIPLSEFVTTSPQNGLQAVQSLLQQKGNAQTANSYLRQLLSGANGSSNVFLVDATSLHDALAASFEVLVGSRSAETPAPVNAPNPKRGTFWLVAYLGTAPSNPTWWTIESVNVTNNRVVLDYRKAKPTSATADSHRYYYWVPLGKLTPGVYEIQLRDVDQNAVNLMRRVEVTLN